MIGERNHSVIIVAGGKGERAGGDLPKQFQPIADKPMLMHTLQAFYDYDETITIILVLPAGYGSLWERLCVQYRSVPPHRVTYGGETRFHSVKNGLLLIPEEGLVAVHDAARPLVTKTLIGRCYEAAATHHCGVIPVTGEVNSVRLITDDGHRILDRRKLRVVQTPQVFPAAPLKRAYATGYDPAFTDDASVAEHHGMKIMLIEGEQTNLKITTPTDFVVARQMIK